MLCVPQLRSTLSPTANCTSRREVSSSSLRRAGALLQQRQHFRSHVPHQVRGSLAGPCWVGCSRGVQGAARMLAAVGVEGRVAGAEGRG